MRGRKAASAGARRPDPRSLGRSVTLVLRYARPYRRHIAVGLAATVALVAIQLAVPWIVRRLVSSVQESVAGSVPVAVVGWLAVGLLALYLVRAFMRFTSSYFSHFAGWGVVADARRDVYEHLQRLSLRFYEDQQTGQLMSRDGERHRPVRDARAARRCPTRSSTCSPCSASARRCCRDELAARPAHPRADPARAPRGADVHPARDAPPSAPGSASWPSSTRRSRTTSRASARSRPSAARCGRPTASDARIERLPAVAAARPAPDGHLHAVRRVRLVARHGHRDLVRRPARPRRTAALARPRRLLPLPRDVLRPRARPERRLGAGAGVAGRRRAGRRAAGRAARHRRPRRAPCRCRTGSRGPCSSGTCASATPAGNPCWSTSRSTSRRAP